MKIAASQINATNDYQRDAKSERRVTQAKSDGSAAQVTLSQASQVQARQELMVRQQRANADQIGDSIDDAVKGKKTDDDAAIEAMEYVDKSLYMMKMVIEEMTGKKVELFDAHDMMQRIHSKENAAAEMGVIASGEGEGSPDDLMIVENYEYEKESNHLQIAGMIQREDGSQTRFALDVSFSQEYERYSMEMIKREQLKDPLVISFSTKPVQLDSEKFNFDIDADGQEDNIAMLERGHGFLALDNNGDGVINDGSELFGALTGNGFAELAQHDENQDGFIDENDSIFDKLSVWIKNDGEDRQVNLKDAGIGAIGLENVDTPLNIRDGDEKLGVIRKSGFYLDEGGKAGLVQQLDFVV